MCQKETCRCSRAVVVVRGCRLRQKYKDVFAVVDGYRRRLGRVGYRWSGWVLVHLFLGRHHHIIIVIAERSRFWKRQATEERKQKSRNASVHNN